MTTPEIEWKNRWKVIPDNGLDLIKKKYNYKRIATLFEYFANILPINSRVLEIGCGKGTYLRYLKKKRPDIKYYGIDISKDAINCCSDNGINGIVGDITNKLPYPSNYFNLVFSLGVIEHFEEKQIKFICNEHKRVSKKYILIMTPSKDTLAHFEWYLSNKIINKRTYQQTKSIDGLRYSPYDIICFFGKSPMVAEYTGNVLPFEKYTNWLESIVPEFIWKRYGSNSYCIFIKE